MKNPIVLFLIALVVIAASVIGFIISTHNGMVRIENTIDAEYNSYENIHSNYFLSIKEMAKISDKYTDQFKEVYDNIMRQRYSGGEDAMFKLIRESNPNYDSELFKNIQHKIAAGRKELTHQEKIINDSKRIAYNKLDVLVSGSILKSLGFPRKSYGYSGTSDDYPIARAQETINERQTGIKEMVDF